MGGVGRFVFNVKTKVKNIVQKNIEINDMINSNNESIELLHNKDEKKALQLYEELQRRKAMFYLPGETAMALNVVEQIAKLQSVVNKG